MTEQLYVTQHLRDCAARDGSPETRAGVETVETLVRLILAGRTKECEDLTESILHIENAGHVTLAMAIGVIAHAELGMRQARKTLSGLVDEAPDVLGVLKDRISDERGTDPADREELHKKVDEAIKKGL